MSFAEVDVFGVYVAPIVPMIVVAWLLLLPLRRAADRIGLLRFVWHPPLFVAGLYAVLLSSIVLLVSRGAG